MPITNLRKIALGGLGALIVGSAAPGIAAVPVADDLVPTHGDIAADRRAGMPPNILASLGAPLADEDLVEMRGKFISPDAVSYFGISMLTSWQDAQGVTTLARLAFNVDFLNGASGGIGTPRLMIGWVRDGGGDPNMDIPGAPEGYVAGVGGLQVMPIGALDTLDGAGQVNVIAGADNSTSNSLRFAVVPRNSVPEMSYEGLSPISSTQSIAFEDGDQLQFSLSNNEIGLTMTGSNGLDSSLQSLGGSFGQFLQQIMIQSSGNSVLNNASITVGVDALQNFERVQVGGARMSMKGLGF